MTPYERILRVLRTIDAKMLALRAVIDESVPAANCHYTYLRNQLKEIERLTMAAGYEAEHPEEPEHDD